MTWELTSVAKSGFKLNLKLPLIALGEHSSTVTLAGRPLVPTTIAGTLWQEAIARQAIYPLVATSRSIKKPTPTAGMFPGHYCNNQVDAISSVGFNACLKLTIDSNWVQCYMSYHLHVYCNNNCTQKAWHRAIMAAEIAQLKKFLHPSSSTSGGSPQLPQGNATSTTVLLSSYSKQELLLSCIPRHHPNTPCNNPSSLAFLCQPSSCGVLLTMY